MSYHIIATEKELEKAVKALAKACPHMKKARRQAGAPSLRKIDNSFASVVRMIASQQLSVAAAAAICDRLVAKMGEITPQHLLATDDDTLRAAGLSRGKIKTLRALAEAVISGEVDFAAFEHMDEDEVRERLVKVHGIGPWTADIYIMFALGRADGFAPGDLALQNACMALMELENKPTPAELAILAEPWRPFRGVAALQLWQYYSWLKKQKKTPF
jgi:DNA-3-methyladenine glycosylase II